MGARSREARKGGKGENERRIEVGSADVSRQTAGIIVATNGTNRVRQLFVISLTNARARPLARAGGVIRGVISAGTFSRSVTATAAIIVIVRVNRRRCRAERVA